jgi:pimeloyl-ACP methyl ester carboxylesterase
MGGWVWRDVAGELREAGHEVYAPTLTGLGERVHLARPEIDAETHVTDVVNLLVYEDLQDVVLAGHSYAAAVVQGVADRAPERLAGLVYLDTGPYPDGMALLDFYSPEGRAATEAVVQEHGEGWRLPFPDIDDLGQQASLAGLDEHDLSLMIARATPQPIETFRRPVPLTRAYADEYDRALILCTDGGFTTEQLRGTIASGAPMFQPLAAPDWRFEELPTGHWPMLSMPAELAALLEKIAVPK